MLFNEISENCSNDEYVEVDNTLATSKEVDISKVDWWEKLQNECIEEVLDLETANSDLEDEDEDESQESSSSSIIAPKEALSILDKVHLFATYNENNRLSTDLSMSCLLYQMSLQSLRAPIIVDLVFSYETLLHFSIFRPLCE